MRMDPKELKEQAHMSIQKLHMCNALQGSLYYTLA